MTTINAEKDGMDGYRSPARVEMRQLCRGGVFMPSHPIYMGIDVMLGAGLLESEVEAEANRWSRRTETQIDRLVDGSFFTGNGKGKPRGVLRRAEEGSLQSRSRTSVGMEVVPLERLGKTIKTAILLRQPFEVNTSAFVTDEGTLRRAWPVLVEAGLTGFPTLSAPKRSLPESPVQIAGFPVFCTEHMEGEDSIIFGSLLYGYGIGEKPTAKLHIRSYEQTQDEKAKGIVRYEFVLKKEVAGDLVDGRALSIIKIEKGDSA